MSALDERATALDAFIQAAGWEDAERSPLQADASFRRYIRLRNTASSHSIMIMDAPPPKEDIRPFVKVATHIKENGFSSPEIYFEDIANGFLALEDFGQDTFTQLLARGVNESELYTAAIKTLAAMHNNDHFGALSVPHYDQAYLLEEVDIFVDWYYPEISGREISPQEREEYYEAWRRVFEDIPPLRPTLVLRDFHVDNLMLLPDRDGVARCGLLDFQDALIGSPAYDVASILEDARRDISSDFRDEMLNEYFQLCPKINSLDFMLAYKILSAQRHTKIIGIFSRLHKRDNKAGYLKHLPRVVQYLHMHLQDPALKPVKDWFDKTCPTFRELPASLTGRKDD
ncbi:MAG: phosphotransferase [Alphaproteobacteria bacterium]|nr:phosphotransferase [Alphaproteobacteria bacterium]